MKEFIARYRYPDPDGIGPKEVWKTITATSLRAARQIAKSYEGRDEELKWFMGVEPKQPKPATFAIRNILGEVTP